MSRLPSLLVGLGVALLAAAIVLVAANADRARQAPAAEVSPSAAPSLTPDPTEAAGPRPSREASPRPSPATPDELAAAFAGIEEQVVALRGLPSAEIGPPEIVTGAELREELEELFAEDYPEAERRADNLTLRALGVLEPDEDIAELQLDLLGQQVLGFYDHDTERMVVVSDGGLTPLAKMTYAHEYVHALQDAAGWGFDALEIDAPGEDDRGLARLALLEGDATSLMTGWAFEHLEQEELLAVLGAPAPDTSRFPDFLVDSLEFPYVVGTAFVTSLIGSGGGFEAVDAAYADLPETTEQILHPEKYLAREPAVEVALPDLGAALGAGWETVETSTFGEASLRFWLEALGVPFGAAGEAAAGWGGDRLTVAAGPADGYALALRIAWDTPADAEEFAGAYAAGRSAAPGVAELVALPDGSQLVVHASDAALVALVVDAVE